uniref:Uncharacterized protein n=1 Tax=Candidatus Kentrum sp. LPFa TaxID=2126335 RepID=A0A450XX04_9GAMM|nr:MAG: hypothetical protein BECKLPF1236A_GA0070988_102243 [Candidatus Kentron sp. LPFa]VFK33818.1 MAG: hypothetical protein BECKLPF1236C_GA0070990_102263 [Candidatus Kentron sp. LPFa]
MPSVQGRTRTGTLWFLSEPHGFRLSAESPRLTLPWEHGVVLGALALWVIGYVFYNFVLHG